MALHYILILLSLGLLTGGAEMLVKGSASVAARAGLTPLMIGLTVVAFGTSSPELAVSLKAALVGQGDVAVGNVIGSNILNIAVILGISAVICPVVVHLQLIKIDVPIMILVTILLPLLLLDGTIGRLEGGLLFAGIVALYPVQCEIGEEGNQPRDSQRIYPGSAENDRPLVARLSPYCRRTGCPDARFPPAGGQ